MENEILLTDETKGRLRGLSKTLLRLHKTLLDLERANYENLYGKVQSTGEMFRLVLNDPYFAWLRTFSGLIVEVDEFLASKTPTNEADGLALLETVKSTLSFEGVADEFGDKYQRALQKYPEAVVNHNEALKFTK